MPTALDRAISRDKAANRRGGRSCRNLAELIDPLQSLPADPPLPDRTACGCAFSSCSKIAGDFVAHPLFSPSPDCCEIPHAIRVLSAPRRQFPFAAILRVFRRDRQVHSDLRLLTGGLHGGGGETRRRSGRGRAPKAFARSRYRPAHACRYLHRANALSLSLRKRHKSPDTRRLLKGDCVYPLANARA